MTNYDVNITAVLNKVQNYHDNISYTKAQRYINQHQHPITIRADSTGSSYTSYGLYSKIVYEVCLNRVLKYHVHNYQSKWVILLLIRAKLNSLFY